MRPAAIRLSSSKTRLKSSEPGHSGSVRWPVSWEKELTPLILWNFNPGGYGEQKKCWNHTMGHCGDHCCCVDGRDDAGCRWQGRNCLHAGGEAVSGRFFCRQGFSELWICAMSWRRASSGSAPGDSDFEQEVAASGIAGDVVLGPRCPVIGPGMEEQCADKGYQTTLVVETKDGKQEVARVQSGVDGRFRVALAPGEYIVAPLPGAGPLPNCAMQFVTVDPGQFTPLTVHCDTGIR